MNIFYKTYQTLKEKIEVGLIENLTLFFVNKENPVLSEIPSKIDSGNDGMMVLHAIILEQNDDYVKFRTCNNKILKMKKHGDIVIHIGSGNKEIRPVVAFDVLLGDELYKKVLFSLADRSENDYPILISKDFISQINALINVNKQDIM